MIGWAAIEHFMNGASNTPLNFSPRARWSVEDIKIHL